jgi:ADP-ribose pyrophosphatase YjhB (NUDIX family)
VPDASPTILARGPWSAEDVSVRWTEEPWQAPAELERGADAAVDALRARESPSHDGMAARLAAWRETESGGLELDLEPVRWALRLVDHAETRSLTALCVVRTEDGRWLAGRRAAWGASWAGRWALGAGGAVEVGENPAETLTRELEEEWQLKPTSVSIEALTTMPSGLAALIGVATVPNDAEAIPDAEHDEMAWWPADVDDWPPEAHERLCALARALTARR